MRADPTDVQLEAFTVFSVLNYLAMVLNLTWITGKKLGSASCWDISGLSPTTPLQVDGEPFPVDSTRIQLRPVHKVRLCATIE